MRDGIACESCTRAAHDLHLAGRTVEQIAAALHVRCDVAEELVAIGEAAVELEAFKMDRVPTEGLRALLHAAVGSEGGPSTPEPVEQGRIPDDVLKNLVDAVRMREPKTFVEIAEAAGYAHGSSLMRKFGVAAKAGSHEDDPDETRFHHEIDVDVASRMVRELGLAPCDVPWL